MEHFLQVVFILSKRNFKHLKSWANRIQKIKIRKCSHFKQKHNIDIEKGNRVHDDGLRFHDGKPSHKSSSSSSSPTIDDHFQQQQQETSKNPSKVAVVCRVVLIAVSLIFLFSVVTLVWYYMGWMYGVQVLLVTVAAIIISKVGWRWFYIAAVTTPRDVK